MVFGVNRYNCVQFGGDYDVLSESVLDFLFGRHLEFLDGGAVDVAKMADDVLDRFSEEMLNINYFLTNSSHEIFGSLGYLLHQRQFSIGMQKEVSVVLVVQSIGLVVFHEDDVLGVGQGLFFFPLLGHL